MDSEKRTQNGVFLIKEIIVKIKNAPLRGQFIHKYGAASGLFPPEEPPAWQLLAALQAVVPVFKRMVMLNTTAVDAYQLAILVELHSEVRQPLRYCYGAHSVKS